LNNGPVLRTNAPAAVGRGAALSRRRLELRQTDRLRAVGRPPVFDGGGQRWGDSSKAARVPDERCRRRRTRAGARRTHGCLAVRVVRRQLTSMAACIPP